MNTANLQLEGLYAAVSALLTMLREKGLLTADEIEEALASTEARLAADPARPPELSGANVEAICFPLRYLRLANRLEAGGEPLSFSEVARRVGRGRPGRGS